MIFGKQAVVFAALGFVAYLLSGCYFMPDERATVAAPTLYEPEQSSYKTIEVKKQKVFEKMVRYTGSLTSSVQSEHFYKLKGGHIGKIFVKPGDRVEAGDILIELDTASIESQIKQQEIALQKAETGYAQLKVVGQLDIESARLQLNDLIKRLKGLKKSPEASQDEIAALEIQIRKKEIDLEKLENSYDKDFGYELKKAQIDVEEAALRLRELCAQLDESKLIAEISGEVTYVTALREGDYVDAGKSLVLIVDPRQMQIVYSGKNIDQFKPGMEVAVTVEGKSCTGRVEIDSGSSSGSAGNSSHKSVLVKLENTPEGIKIGDAAVMNLTLERSENTIVLPENAVRSYGTRRFVHVLKDGVRTERDVKIGIETQTEVEVIEGLKIGEKVIIK